MSPGLVLRDAEELSGALCFSGFSAVVCYLLSMVSCFSVICRLFGFCLVFCGLFSGLSCGFCCHTAFCFAVCGVGAGVVLHFGMSMLYCLVFECFSGLFGCFLRNCYVVLGQKTKPMRNIRI